MSRYSTITVLCPGPSLTRFIEAPDESDLVIGVTRAVEAWPCDWWVFGDHWAMEWFTPRGRPRIFAPLESFERGNSTMMDYYGWESWQSLNGISPLRLSPQIYSVCAAMVLAGVLRPTSIVVHGCDHDGIHDWDGKTWETHNRNDNRWKDEARMLNKVMDWLGGMNIAAALGVVRCPDGR